MKLTMRLAVTAVASAAIGALAVEAIHAQAKPPGYFIAEVEVSDAESFSRDYSAKVPATVAPFGGHWLVRGGRTVDNEGEPPKPRVIVIAFDNLEKAQAWRDSAAYKALIPIRDKAAKVRSFFVEGVAP